MTGYASVVSGYDSDSADIDLSVESPDWDVVEGLESYTVQAVKAGLAVAGADVPGVELSLRFVDEDESQALNKEWRDRDKPTNVLSFPGVSSDEIGASLAMVQSAGPPVLLGDLVLCHGVLAREAAAQHKSLQEHLVHLIIHGVLHLLGYDHIEEEEAFKMEELERQILKGLGIEDPYQERDGG